MFTLSSRKTGNPVPWSACVGPGFELQRSPTVHPVESTRLFDVDSAYKTVPNEYCSCKKQSLARGFLQANFFFLLICDKQFQSKTVLLAFLKLSTPTRAALIVLFVMNRS